MGGDTILAVENWGKSFLKGTLTAGAPNDCCSRGVVRDSDNNKGDEKEFNTGSRS